MGSLKIINDIKKLSLFVSAVIGWPSFSMAETVGERPTQHASKGEIKDWLETAAEMNRPSMTEPAGSHGSFGTEIGVGMTRVSVSEGGSVANQELSHGDNDSGQTAVNIPKVWISKGTMLPLDFTITGGKTADSSFSSIAGIMQVTVFEARALPAVSLRTFIGNTLGNKNTTVTSRGSEVAVSMGFLKYFQGYSAMGIDIHSARYTKETSDDGSQAYQMEENWQQRSFSMGLKTTILPGRMSITAEKVGIKASSPFHLRLSTQL